MKNKYLSPKVEILELQGELEMMNTSIHSDGMTFGGNASEAGVDEANVNVNNAWEIW